MERWWFKISSTVQDLTLLQSQRHWRIVRKGAMLDGADLVKLLWETVLGIHRRARVFLSGVFSLGLG